jgi:anaerobic selenocysteine-containing dehydrogenase
LLIDVEDERVVRVRGDAENPLTRGFTCPKGRHIGDFHANPLRVRSCQRRDSTGELVDIPAADAVGEIADRLQALIAEHGPDSVALITGTQSAMSSLTGPFARAWFKTLGSRSMFTPQTIDQSAKWVAEGRLGSWAAGRQRFDEADVWMLVGTNPLITMQGGDITGFPVQNGFQRLAAEQRRGLKLIVVDPRRTETAARADQHLQLVPGSDAFLFAGLLNVILGESLHDQEFCDRWVPGLADLRAAVAPFTPSVVAAACGLSELEVTGAARTFAQARSGMATTGTGPNMGPVANLSEHLVQCLNVICGRFPRDGDRQAWGGVLGAGRPRPAEAISPDRHWEFGPRDRFGYGQMHGESPIGTLPDRILDEGDDQVRAVIVVGANPASALPDQVKAVQALSKLELLVTLDPLMSETAQLADYVIAPIMQLEKPDTTRAYDTLIDSPFAQYTPAVLAAPDNALDDWEFFLQLAWAMGHSMTIAGTEYAPGSALPSTDEVLASFTRRARIPLEEVKRHPHGKVFDVPTAVVGPASPGASGRFDVMPADVADELAAVLVDAKSALPQRPFTLVVRRSRDTLNSMGTRIPALAGKGFNPCYVHPEDMDELGVETGSTVTITSDHGWVVGVVAADSTIRPGVVSMTHAFGGLPVDNDPLRHGVNIGQIMSLVEDLQTISAMPRMSSLPVTIAKLELPNAVTHQPEPAHSV